MKRIILTLIFSMAIFIAHAQNEFLTTWKTDNPGTSANNQITIPTYPDETYDYTVDWGDGNTESGLLGESTHTYATPGTYQIAISGNFPGIYFGFTSSNDRRKILTVDQWGTNIWARINSAFNGCNNLDVLATDLPDLSNVVSTAGMFISCHNLIGNASFENWNLSNVERMSYMFYFAGQFNQDISSWNVSNVNEMGDMFNGATSFNQEIGTWNVGAVTDMDSMFQDATSFNGDIGAWNLVGLDKTTDMFQRASAFNQDISNWNVSNVRFMAHMFEDAIAFDQDLGSWDIGKVQTINNMFSRATLSTANYESLLTGWASLPVINNGHIFDAGYSQYCNGNAGREELITQRGWTIRDGGDECAFNTTWRTSNTGSSANNQITIPVYPSEIYNFSVDWGDGSFDSNLTGETTHTYASAGTYEVSIYGTFPGIYFGASSNNDKEKILFVNQWGTNVWKRMNSAFHYCRNLDITATDVPDLSNVSSTAGMFIFNSKLRGNSSFANWDVSSITDMNYMFFATRLFNQNIGTWNVSNVTDMSDMFRDTKAFNQPIGNWDVSSVTEMESMFRYATAFNSDINNWNLENLDTTINMFNGATAFNQNISNWNVSNVRFMAYMFNDAEKFNQDISNWNVANVLTMNNMFSDATDFNQDIGSWNVGKVQFMSSMFENATSFDQDLGNWNIKSITGLTKMFKGATLSLENYDSLLTGWNSLPLINNNLNFHGGNSKYCYAEEDRMALQDSHGWTITDGGDACGFITTWKTDNPGSSDDNQITIPTAPDATYNYTVDWGDGTEDTGVTGNITHTYSTSGTYQVSITGVFPRVYFHNNGFALNEGDKDKIILVNQWGNIEWTSMSDAFLGCTNLDVVATDIPDFSNVYIMDDMFNGCISLIGNPTMGDWDMSNVIIPAGMFSGARNFNQPIGNWNMSNATNMSAMFGSAVLFNQPIGDWDVSKVTKMESMFSNAQAFNQPIGNWDVGNVSNMLFMFASTYAFNQDISNWDVGSVNTMRAMFNGSSNFNQSIGNWNVSKVTSMDAMFRNAQAFNQDIGNWNVSKVTEMDIMFEGAVSFNQDIGNWDVSSVNDLSTMFKGAISFDQNLGNWNVGQVTKMIDMFKDAGLSKTNYDVTLIGWANLSTLQNGVQFDAGSSIYCSGEISKLKLIEEYNWSITDAGKECPFITTWKTDNPGVTAANQITIPTSPYESYNYVVDWGDGNIDSGVTGNIIHTYDVPGTYQVSISGFFAQIYFNNYAIGTPQDGDEKKIISVDQWGDIEWRTMKGAFAGCSNLDVLATDIPDFSNLTDLGAMFRFCPTLIGNETFAKWDLSTITSISTMFDGASVFNQDIGSWDVSNVEHMGAVFHNAKVFNQDIGDWDVGNVKYMSWAFLGASTFNQDIGRWNVSNTLEQHATFGGATSFNQDISSWDMSNVYRTDGMFSGAESFNQDISGWDVSNVTTMNTMFHGTKAFNQDISNWNVSNVTDTRAMFDESVFDQSLGEWDVSNVIYMNSMFNKSKLSTSNYDSTLIGWATQTLQPNVEFYAGSSEYCDGETARQSIIDTFGWTIFDEGKDVNCNLDNDNDLVLDHLDLCLNTPEDSTVNSEGCLVLAANNFNIETLGETCPDSNNAQILIASEVALDFIATVNGVDYDFSNQLTMENLQPGLYDLCIKYPLQSFEQCYVLELVGSESISGKSTIDNGKMAIELEKGTAPFEVLVNGKKAFQTSSRSFDVDVFEGDVVEVTSAKICEGSFTKSVDIGASIAYPNPTRGSFEITLPMMLTEADIEVFTLQSQLVSKNKYPVIGGKVSMDIKNLPSGMYMVKVNMENPKMFKIVKQ